MNSYLAKKIYLSAEYVRGEPLKKTLDELEKSQWLSLPKLEENLITKIKILVNHAYKNVPYYRDLFNIEGIDPYSIKDLSDLKKIPILTKELFRKNALKLLAENHPKRIDVAKTSGSTGLSLSFYKDRLTTAYHRAPIFRGHRWHGLDVGSKEAKLWGVPVNLGERLFIRISDFFMNRFREKEYNLTEEILYDFYLKLLRKKPDYLMGYSSMIYQFALFLKENNLRINNCRLKIVKCTSETIKEEYRDIVEQIFRCPLVSEYGSAETGIIAFECPKRNHHLMMDCNYVEFLPLGDHILNQEFKEIVVTDLYNFSMPIIRYKIGDLVVPSNRKCSCGRELPLVEKIEGRSSNLVKGANGKIFHSIIFYYIFKGLSGRGGGVKQFKIIQERENKLIYQLVKDYNYSENTIKYIREKTQQYLGNNMEIEFQFLEIIPRERSGKLRDFVSKIKV